MLGGSNLTDRQAARLRQLLELEDKADNAHKLLVTKWKKGEHDKTLLEEDRKVHAELEEARKEYAFGLKVKP